jgi:hypothetical protein
MNANRYDVALEVGEATDPRDEGRNVGRPWSVITALVALAVLFEAIFAGAMLSGVDWARTAHAVNAAVLIASALTAGLVAVVTLRGIPHGSRLGWTLLRLAAVVIVQAALGAWSAKGTNLLWLHVPLGVALFGFATRAAIDARRLGGR